MVTLIEAALERVGSQWGQQTENITNKMEAMLALQKARLELDRERLEFEREMAGLPAKRKPRNCSGITKLLNLCNCITCPFW